MKRTLVVLVAAMTACCSGHGESPFIDGSPPADIQEHFLSACQIRDDRRDPGVSGNDFTAGSDAPALTAIPDPNYRGPNCRVHLTWKGSKISSLWVLVNNNGPFFEEFVRKAVLPLLKPSAALIVREQMLDHLATGPRAKKRIPVPGGAVSTELLWYQGPGRPFLTAAELSVGR